jgi:integrase
VTYLTDEEIAELLDTAKPPFDSVFRFLLATGLRVNEFLNVRWRDIDLTQYRTVTVQAWAAKTDEARTVPLPDDVVDSLHDELNAQESDPASRPWPHATRSRIRTEWQRCRVLMKRDDDPEFVPHILRHTCATRLLHRGVPTKSVQAWLGHKLITTTERYLHQSASELHQFRNVGTVSESVSGVS